MNDLNGAVVTLSEEQCWNLLSRYQLGRLALDVGGGPDIFPVNYVTDGPRVLFRTAPGSKLAGLTQNPRVAFEVDEFDDEHGATAHTRNPTDRTTATTATVTATRLASVRPVVATSRRTLSTTWMSWASSAASECSRP